jgi:aspartate kinase
MRKHKLLVQKYGGSSLAEPSQIRDIADRISRIHNEDYSLIIVVSAMGKDTDELINLAYQVSPHPNRREFDMLVSTGERVSMALVSMAINDRKCKSISLTGSQAGVLTDESHSSARITDLKPIRIESELNKNHVVVIAGFQGVSPITKEVTTLGRGGSDTTAVALSAYFKAERCEILKDVAGVFSADPHLVKEAAQIKHLHYLQLLDMTFGGAKVLHYRSVELAFLLKVPLKISLAHGEGESTIIDGEAAMYEQARILSVNSHKEVRWIEVLKTDLTSAIQDFYAILKEDSLPSPQLLDTEKRSESCAILITASTEHLNSIQQSCQKSQRAQLETLELSSVAITCKGSFASTLPDEICAHLGRKKLNIHKILLSAMSISLIVEAKDRDRIVQSIHEMRDTSLPQNS